MTDLRELFGQCFKDEFAEEDLSTVDSSMDWSGSIMDLISEADGIEDIINHTRLDFDFETASAEGSEPHSPDNSHAPDQIFTETELMTLSIRELNKRLKTLPKEDRVRIRKRRRSLKNRSYATNCRKRRAVWKDHLEDENKRLKEQLSEVRQQLVNTTKERDFLRKKFEQINNVFSSLSATSFPKKHWQQEH